MSEPESESGLVSHVNTEAIGDHRIDVPLTAAAQPNHNESADENPLNPRESIVVIEATGIHITPNSPDANELQGLSNIKQDTLLPYSPGKKNYADLKGVMKKNTHAQDGSSAPASLSPSTEKPKKRSSAELKAVLKSAVDTGKIFNDTNTTTIAAAPPSTTQNPTRSDTLKRGILQKVALVAAPDSTQVQTRRNKVQDLTEVLRKAVESKKIFQAASDDEELGPGSGGETSEYSKKGRVSVTSRIEFSQQQSYEPESKEYDANMIESVSISEEDEDDDVPIDDKFAKRLKVSRSGKTSFSSGSTRPNSRAPSNLQTIHARSKSLASNGSLSGGLTRELTETWSTIMKKSKFTVLSVILNGCLLGLLYSVRDGLVLNIQASLVNQFGGIILLLVLLICNIVTIWSLNDAGSCIFGFFLSRGQGFSFAVCGYLHVPPLAKMQFAQSLSLTSKYRKNLSRAAFVWIIVEMLKVLTPIGAISLTAEKYATFNDVSDCIYFAQDKKLKPIDRKWPNLDTESGVAEYVFGTSLGIMRSEVPGVNITTAMYPPSLISVVNNGDLIQGLGFTVDISSTCSCARNLSEMGLVAAGVDRSHVNQVIQEYLNMNRAPGITFGVVVHNDSIVISNVFSGYGTICGGIRSTPLVCSTTLWNHQKALLEVTFMTDGTTASIAPDKVNLVAHTGPADVKTWLSFAINSLLGGPVSSYLTPPTVPGSLAPLLWWTTPNLIAIDRAIVEAGLETTYAILFKGAIQRVYTAEGTQCPRKNIIASFESMVTILPSGYSTLVVLLAIQMIVSFLSMLTFGVWLLAPFPIGPAVRATQEPIYLITLLQSSCNVGIGLNDLCNAETYAIWQKLDVRCRIGESIATMEEDVGKIVMDKPSLVRKLKNGKKYR
ncbi:hypothetical protein BDR26DRAFT_897118 [Obelidium mucronatum]|nr:hypothetical protein BDR26DRAFT_897118 [Obelidium mucronatum]